MAQDLVVGGETYKGVERVAATNTEGEVIVYPEDGDTASNAVQYVPQKLTDGEKAQARQNVEAMGRDDIYFRYNAYEYKGDTEHITTVTINVKKIVDGKEVVESVEINNTTLYEHAKLHGYEGEIAEFYDTLARNMQTLKADGLELDPKENILYLTSGGKRIGLGVGMPDGGGGSSNAVQYIKQELAPEQKAQARKNIAAAADSGGDVIIVKLSGHYNTGYNARLYGQPVPVNGLEASSGSGCVIIGVADGDITFSLGDEDYNEPYTVPTGTVFNYSNRMFWTSNRVNRFGRPENVTCYIESPGSVWTGAVTTDEYTIYLTNDQTGCVIEYNGRKLRPREAYNLLLDAGNFSKPIFCFQKDAVFRSENGSGYVPQNGIQFYYDHKTETLRCERDGYDLVVHVDLDTYSLTATKNTPYQVAESKADDLELDPATNTLSLMSAGEPIGMPITLPSGGDGGVTAPVNGFFTLSVDEEGNLWAHSAEGGPTPEFEYDSETGNLYFVTEE